MIFSLSIVVVPVLINTVTKDTDVSVPKYPTKGIDCDFSQKLLQDKSITRRLLPMELPMHRLKNNACQNVANYSTSYFKEQSICPIAEAESTVPSFDEVAKALLQETWNKSIREYASETSKKRLTAKRSFFPVVPPNIIRNEMIVTAVFSTLSLIIGIIACALPLFVRTN